MDGMIEAVEKKSRRVLLGIKIASFAAVILLMIASFAAMNTGIPERGEISILKTDDLYEIDIEYDREMSFGTVDMEFDDVGGTHHYITIGLVQKENGKNILHGEYTGEEIDSETLSLYNLTNFSADQVNGMVIFLGLLFPFAFAFTLIFAGTLTTGVNVYYHKGRHVMVYNGCVDHKLVVNGKTLNAMTSVLPFFNHNFGAEYEGDVYQVKVSKVNRARLFVNGVEAKPGEIPEPENDDFETVTTLN